MKNKTWKWLVGSVLSATLVFSCGMLSQASTGTAIDANVVSDAATIIASNGARAVTATIPSNGATIVKKGTCGENLTWTLNSSGTLNISGKGEMYAYVDWYEDVP